MIKRLSIVGIIFGAVVVLISAQEFVDLRPILSSQHGARLDVPIDWQTTFFETDGVLVSETDDVFMVVYLTDALRRQGYTSSIPAQLNQQVAQDYEFEDQVPQIIETQGEFRNVLIHADGILLSETYGDNRIMLMDVRTDDVDGVLDILVAMVNTLEPYTESIEVENYRAGWRVIIAELLAKGYIREGDMIQSMPIIEFSGDGNQYSPFAEDDIAQDIVVGATINLQASVDDMYETCGVMSRVVGNETNGVANFLEVGVDSDGDAYIFDRFGSGETDATLNYSSISGTDNAVNVIYKVDGGLANVFANGQLVFSNLLIQEREGYFGLSFVGHSEDASCTFTDVWFYAMGTDCTLTVADNRDTYFSPDEIEFALGEVMAETPYVTDAYYLDAEMTPWWRIAIDARWMRGEDVTVNGACGAVDFVENLADVN